MCERKDGNEPAWIQTSNPAICNQVVYMVYHLANTILMK